MYCCSCGTKNRQFAKFCRICGQPMGRSTRIMYKRRPNHLILLLAAPLLIGIGFATAQLVEELAPDRSPAAQLANNAKQADKTTIIKNSQEKVYTVKTGDAYGSGFLFTDQGHIVTSAHLVMGKIDVTVRDSSGHEQEGKVIGISNLHDIALVKVETFVGNQPLEAELAPAQAGMEVIALGSPSGFENTAAIGYLTGIDRDFDQEFLYEDMYQIDVQMALGSSGGPLIDAESGKVIGINSLLLIESNGIGFAIPLYTMHDLLVDWSLKPMTEQDVLEVFDRQESYSNLSPVVQPAS